jgi:hypothetical protein
MDSGKARGAHHKFLHFSIRPPEGEHHFERRDRWLGLSRTVPKSCFV